MKRKIMIRALLLFPVMALVWLGISCEPKETLFEGPYFVRFTREDTTVRESYSKPLRISVHNAGPQLAEPIQIKYLVSGNAREGIDYQFLSKKGEVVIPAGQSFGYITLQLINNANNILESQDIVFTLVEVQPTTLRVGFGNAEIGRIMRFTVLDDCILSGTYTGANANQTPSPIKGGISISSADCREYIVSNWNINTRIRVGTQEFDVFGLDAFKPDVRFIDNGDNSLTIPRQVETQLIEPYDTIQGSGSVNPRNGQITLNIRYQLPFRTPSNKDTIVSATQTLVYTPEK